MQRKLCNGVVLYNGPSLLDGKPIVVIAVNLATASRNRKTGNAIGTYILRADMNPLRALGSADRSVCGSCKHKPRRVKVKGKRRLRAGTCYVNVAQAPLSVWRAWRKGAYPAFDPREHLHLFRGRLLRLGSYGDPAAVPMEAWLPLLVTVDGHMGYTHQWATCDQDWRRFVMASVDSPAERELAQSMGWRTFRVHLGGPLLPGEITCPASAEAGKRRTCASCKACDGQTDSGTGRTIAIVAHGLKSRRYELFVI